MATIYIDNKEYEVEEGKNLLETCLSLGLNLTYFCWHPELDSVGACRQCAVLNFKDEEDTRGRLVMACMERVSDGMRISIEGPKAKEFRAGNIEALMLNHPHDCPVCDEGGECHLQDMTVMSGHNYRRYEFNKRTHNNQYLGPFINHEMNRCIQCYRCVRFYNDYADGTDFNVFSSHDSVFFGRSSEGTLESEFSGNLVEVCPTGVFTDKTLKKHYTRKWDLTSAPSVCHGCSLGCNILVSERYGSIRRVLTRYNSDINGYFLCDRGRFGYEYTNSENRILHPFKKLDVKKGDAEQGQIEKEVALKEIKKLLSSSKKTIGIGSPRASLESNFLLQKAVGKDNFYAGVSAQEGKLVNKVKNILKDGQVRTPSMKEAESFDAVFVIGEDLTNTAPMLALALRQTAKTAPNKKAGEMRISEWDNYSVKQLVQNEKGPFYVATTHKTKLNNIATESFYCAPDDIARLAQAVAHEIDSKYPKVEGLDAETVKSVKAIAKNLKSAQKPLIVSGVSLFSEAIVDASASLAYALKGQNEETGIIYNVPEVNSMGLALLTENYLEDACKESADVLVTLENDLFHRTDAKQIENLYTNAKHAISLESLHNETTRLNDYVLPAGTYAESTGTAVNNEGRAQRFYQTFVPENDMQSSWAWLAELLEKGEDYHFDQVVADLVKDYPDLKLVEEAGPNADLEVGTQKIPRSPHRFSGRTSKRANKDVSEEKPPVDKDSPMTYTMEGFQGRQPSSATSFYWAPGWNSAQAINKYQIEVGGELHGGNPGKRLLEASKNDSGDFNVVPTAFAPKEGQLFALPVYYIYGSEELTAQSPAVEKQIPETKFFMNDEDAKKHSIEDGDQIEINYNDNTISLQVKLDNSLAKGILGIPKGFKETAGFTYPFWADFKKL